MGQEKEPDIEGYNHPQHLECTILILSKTETGQMNSFLNTSQDGN